MTGNPGEGWKVFADGDDSEDVPLWKVLALLTSDDLDEGLKANAAVINQTKPRFVRYYNVAFGISMFFGFLFVVFLMAFAPVSTIRGDRHPFDTDIIHACGGSDSAPVSPALPIWDQNSGCPVGIASPVRPAF